jgi:hypothetical protein
MSDRKPLISCNFLKTLEMPVETALYKRLPAGVPESSRESSAIGGNHAQFRCPFQSAGL